MAAPGDERQEPAPAAARPSPDVGLKKVWRCRKAPSTRWRLFDGSVAMAGPLLLAAGTGAGTGRGSGDAWAGARAHHPGAQLRVRGEDAMERREVEPGRRDERGESLHSCNGLDCRPERLQWQSLVASPFL
jgi:hypothetical protein